MKTISFIIAGLLALTLSLGATAQDTTKMAKKSPPPESLKIDPNANRNSGTPGPTDSVQNNSERNNNMEVPSKSEMKYPTKDSKPAFNGNRNALSK